MNNIDFINWTHGICIYLIFLQYNNSASVILHGIILALVNTWYLQQDGMIVFSTCCKWNLNNQNNLDPLKLVSSYDTYEQLVVQITKIN